MAKVWGVGGEKTGLLGRILRSEAVAKHVLSIVEYGSMTSIPSHEHAFACFTLVLEGAQTEEFSSKAISCKARQVFFRPSHTKHKDRFLAGGARCFTLEVSPHWLDDLEEFVHFRKEPEVLVGHRSTQVASRLYKEWIEPDNLSSFMIEALALELAGEFIRERKMAGEYRPPPWLRRVAEFVHEHAAEPWSLSGLASVAGVHPMHMAREFHRYYGASVGECIRQRRTQMACELLRTTDLPLVEVAIATGFANQSHFTTVMKRMAGTTPATYRVRTRPA